MPLYGASSGGSGTVTSVGLSAPAVLYTVSNSPVTTSGTLTETLQTQTANTVFSGPGSGGAVAPTFRALVANDIPNLDWAKITSGKPTTATGYGITLVASDIPATLNSTTNILVSDAATNTEPTVLTVKHRTSATAVAGLGTLVQFQADSSTTQDQPQGAIIGSWQAAVHSARVGRLALWAYDFGGAREGFRVEGAGAGNATKIAFYGATAIVQPTVTGAKGSNAALGSLMTALSTLGLVTDSTTA